MIRYTLRNGNQASVIYNGFKVKDEQAHYAISVESVAEKTGIIKSLSDEECLHFNNQPFNTRDQDPIGLGRIARSLCAEFQEGGWWFGLHCAYLCPTCNWEILRSKVNSVWVGEGNLLDVFVGMRLLHY